MPTCECGCGSDIPPHPFHKYRKTPIRFLRGHHQRTSAFRASRQLLVLSPPDGWTPPTGICECGCGERTKVARQSSTQRSEYRGFPQRFIHGHNGRGANNGRWKGGRRQTRNGHWILQMPGHHLANANRVVMEHRLIWEQTNGRRLERHEVVHHIDGNPANNDPANLVALTVHEHRMQHREHTDEARQKMSAAHRQRAATAAARNEMRQP